jgi:hypothetical protein
LVRTLIAIMIIALDGELSSAFARKASRHHPDCAASTISRRLRPIRVASLAITTRSRSIER